MANNRRNRYNPDFDERYSEDPIQRSSRDTDTGTYTESTIDTGEISRNLENKAEEEIRISRRNKTYRNAGSTGSSSRRHTQEIDSRSVRESYSRSIDDEEEKYKERKRQRREMAFWKRAHWIVRFLIIFVLILDVLILRFGVFRGGFLPVWNVLTSKGKTPAAEAPATPGLPISEQFLTENEYSRPGTPLDGVNGIVIHYIGNPGTDAQANRDYFESLKDGSTGVSASCNYIIGLDGTIIHCVPDNEIAYASGERNHDTISIECCHPDDSGAFTQETFQSLVLLTAKLCQDNGLTTEQVLRHYDVNQKPCPKYFVDDTGAWENFLASVESCM